MVTEKVTYIEQYISEKYLKNVAWLQFDEDSSDPHMINPKYNGQRPRNAELQLILDMSRRAEEAGKIAEFNEEAARLQYEDWNMSRIDAMRKALIKVLDKK
jgi:hypothetical protein